MRRNIILKAKFVYLVEGKRDQKTECRSFVKFFGIARKEGTKKIT